MKQQAGVAVLQAQKGMGAYYTLRLSLVENLKNCENNASYTLSRYLQLGKTGKSHYSFSERCVQNYLNAKYGNCNFLLPFKGKLECPNALQRIYELVQLRNHGLAYVKAKTNCDLTCNRVEYDIDLVSHQDSKVLFQGERMTNDGKLQ